MNKINLMVFHADGSSKTIPLNLQLYLKAGLATLAGAIVAGAALLSYNMIKLSSVRSSYTQTLQNLSVEKRNFDQRLNELEDFEEKISFFLGGALADVENAGVEVTFDSGMGGGMEFEPDDPSQVAEIENNLATFSVPQRLRGAPNEQERIRELKQSLQELAELALKEKRRLDFTPSVMPIQGYITSQFGWRISPFTGSRHLHRGLDIVNKIGTPVAASASGRVVFADKEEFWGKAVFIAHRDGIITKYGHLSEISVKPGQMIERGDKVGEVGMSGRTTGPHLHYQIEINGKAVDPLRFLIDDFSSN